MGDLLAIVEKQYGGETWANTHCLRMNATGGTVNDADMAALGIATAITATNTASGGAVNPITRLLSFERLMHRPPVTITRVYITDGKRNLYTDPDYFWSATVSLVGLIGTTIAAGDLAPGSIAWVVNRIPLGYTTRSGRMFIRGTLLDASVQFNMRGGVDWTASSDATSHAGFLSSAVSGSGINTHLNGGTNAGVALYCVPHYLSARLATDPHQIGTLIGATPVTSFTSSAPRSRQMLRGKKRKKSTTVLA